MKLRIPLLMLIFSVSASFAAVSPSADNRAGVAAESTTPLVNTTLDLQGFAPTPIPEPATYMLLGFGILVCAQQFRRKKG